MRLESTRGQSPPVSFREAIIAGIAPDGGLYLPIDLPSVPAEDLDRWRDLTFPSLAVELSRRLLAGEFSPEVIERLVSDALDFPAPTIKLSPGVYVLELFHGPTLAFKDFGARFLARFFSHLLADRGEQATILVATSGDTGSAVAHGFFGVPSVTVVVLYPKGKVSRFQEAQMATLGGNILAVAVPGTFDDCQRLAKTAFLDRRLARLRLSSANSINVGRLLPQSFYYFASYLAATARTADRVIFSVPSGNLGNLTAGVIAGRLGLPVRRFIGATNVNDVLTEYVRTGVYRARPSIATISNAMDVGDPNNFPRLLALHGGSLEELRAKVWSTSVNEQETREAIRRVYETTGYVLDPHGAVGWVAAERLRREQGDDRPIIALLTAHPAKFGDAIEEELGFRPELPELYRDWAIRPLLAKDLPDTEYDTFRDFLLSRRA